MAFTPITRGLDWQSAAFVNELVGAYSERKQALSGAAVDAVVAGDDIQLASLWSAIQTWIDANLAQFVNHDLTIAGSQYDAIMFTTSTFRALAGLHYDGWRRATTWAPGTDDWTDLDDAMWSRTENGHGVMQAGDIIGPWIFDDLQKALDALRWTKKTVTISSTISGQGSSSGNCEADRTDAINAFYTWHPSGVDPCVAAEVNFNDSAAGWGWSVLLPTGATVTGIPVHVAHTPSLYMYLLEPVFGGTYMDLLSLGLTEGELLHVRDLAQDTVATRDCAPYPGSSLTCPIEAAGLTCSSTYGTYGCEGKGMAIIKWNFTHTL